MMSVVELSRMQPRAVPAPLPMPPSQHELGYHSLPQSLGATNGTPSRPSSAKTQKEMNQKGKHRYNSCSSTMGGASSDSETQCSASSSSTNLKGSRSRPTSGTTRPSTVKTRPSSAHCTTNNSSVPTSGTHKTSGTHSSSGTHPTTRSSQFNAPPPYPGYSNNNNFNGSNSEPSVSPNASMSSCEGSINNGVRQDPPGEETQQPGTPNYLYSGCQQYKNNMLAQLGLNLMQSASNGGETKPTGDNTYYVTGNRHASPIPADSAHSHSRPSLPIPASIPGSGSLSPSSISSQQSQQFHQRVTSPNISHIGRSSIAHYVNIPAPSSEAVSATSVHGHGASVISSHQSSPFNSAHVSPLHSGNTSPSSSTGTPHMLVHPTYPSQQMVGSPSVYYSPDVLIPTTSQHLSPGTHIVCTSDGHPLQQTQQFLPSNVVGQKPSTLEGNPSQLQIGQFVEIQQPQVSLPQDVSPEDKDAYLKNMQHYLNMLNLSQASGAANMQEVNNNNMYRVPMSTQSQGHFSGDSNGSIPEAYMTQQKQQPDINHATIAVKATQMVEKLSEDNRTLRKELEKYLKKMSKVQKFEMDIERINNGYEALMKHSQKREKLEEKMRIKMDMELRKLKETNAQLKDQLDKALYRLEHKSGGSMSYEESSLKSLLDKKDTIIGNMIEQNKELSATRDCFELEVNAQRNTLQEQTVHIDMLDTQLLKTQATVARLEREVQQRQQQDYRLEQLQNTVTQLQKTCDKKEQTEIKLREKLHNEVKMLKMQRSSESIAFDDEGIATDTESLSSMSSNQPTSTQLLQQQLEEKDQRILELEAELAKTEQQYLEESVMKQLAENNAEIPKELQMAALEQNSKETEKLISESREDRLKHLEEVYRANRRCAELESSVKTLKSQLAEKDAIIALLHQSPPTSMSSPSSLGSSPMHSPHISGVCSLPLSTRACMAVSPPLSGTSSTTGSAASSRQSSQINSPMHTQSNSTASSSSDSSMISPKEVQLKELQQKIAAQRVLMRSLKSTTEQRKYLSHFL